VVHELAVAQPTAAELELLQDTARDAEEHDLEPEQIEKRLRETRLWHLLKVLAKNDQRMVLYLTLLIMIYQTWVMVHPPEAAPPPAPHVTVNVTVDPNEIAEKVAKQLQDEGVCLVPERQDR
jgi:hypothetical protein